MEIRFENVCLWTDENPDSTKPIIVACKDRTVKDGEKWVLAGLSKKELKQVYENLQQYFNDKD